MFSLKVNIKNCFLDRPCIGTQDLAILQEAIGSWSCKGGTRTCMKHGGSVSVTARQQTYCASNLEQGGEVPRPAPSVLRKAKLSNDSIARNCWRNAGETLEMILA